jgi:prefoldin subunit 5
MTSLDEIRKRLKENAYFINPHADAHVGEDLAYLLNKIDELEKKNRVLSEHISDLTQEIENVKADFGNQR